MKRFKDASSNDNLIVVADIKTLFKSIFKGKPAPSAPPATPPAGPAVPTLGTGAQGHPKIPKNIPDNYKDAMNIIKGKKQKDEQDIIAKSKWGIGIGAVSLILQNYHYLLLLCNIYQLI
jgi:hypothetical protein